MTVREYIELNPELKDRTMDHLFEIQAFEELEFRIGDDDMGRNQDGMFCEIEEVEEAMLDLNLTSFDIDHIETGGY